MHTFKTVLVVAVLSAVAYGVYVGLTGTPDSEPPPGVTEGWDSSPQVELPTVNVPPAVGGDGGAPPPFVPPSAPSAAKSVTEAPPFSAGSGADVNTAPPFVAPGVGPQSATPPTDIPGATPTSAPDSGLDHAAKPDLNATGAAGAGGASDYRSVCQAGQAMLDEGRMDEALKLYSSWYDEPSLSPEEREQLQEMLNQLAGTVIYSREHLLEQPYEVQPGDTLDRIGEKYNVPYQLLAKINGIDDPNRLRPGDKIKVVRGPFDAVVDLDTKRLTLVLDGRYAGQFPIGVGAVPEQATPEGEFPVNDKFPNPTYNGPLGNFDANDPKNPLGSRWIGLGEGFGIHGTNDLNAAGDARGCIRLINKDVEDVYDILSVGSRVYVRR